MKKYFISILILLSISFAGLISPENGKTLNYTHVLFEWEQEEDAIEYTLYVSKNGNEEISTTTQSLISISEGDLSWNNTYQWKVRPIYSDGSTGSWSEQYTFDIGDTRSSASASGSGSEGITMFSSFLDYYSAAIDESGNEIWNSGDDNLIFYNTDYYGQLFGAQYDYTLVNNLPVIEYNIDNDIVWQEPNDHFSHHEMIQLPNGNYMSIVEEIILGPIPPDLSNNLTLLFQFLGYFANGFTNEFPWVGDRLVEWDENGNEVWSWSTFDHFDMNDYDRIGGTWNAAFNDGRHDWTHANAFWFSEEENAIYFSSRHLSRITKIDYLTGDVIWNLGIPMPSGDVHCGHDLGFSFQHSIIQSEDGKLLTLDNGNISVQLNGDAYPTTRLIEIDVDESNGTCDASIAFEHSLPEELFGFASGNVQKLENQNYLITTVGGGGTSLEITPNGQTIWTADYNLSFPNGAVYRANRLPSLYPVAFSAVISDLYYDNDNETIDYNSNGLEFIIYNDGSISENYCIDITNQCIEISSDSHHTFHIPIDSEIITFEILPEHREDLKKSITIHVNNFPECDEGFTQIENLPNSTIVLDGSECFNDIDLAVLSDIVTANNLNINPITMGTQNWFNGRLTRLLIGNYYDGGNITLTTIPPSIGNLENIAMLYLNYNNITSLPEEISNLTNLFYLILSFNQLTHLPENIGNLSMLNWLDAGYNSIEYLPNSIGDLSNMQYFWIFNNELSFLPDSICNLNVNWNGSDYNFLPYFGSGGNHLCDELPECVENSTHLNGSIDTLSI